MLGPPYVLRHILEDAQENRVPTVFALTRHRLGQIVGRRMRISALAILDHNGEAEVQVVEHIGLTPTACG